MAFQDRNKRPYIADEDKNVFIGLQLPIQKSTGVEGYFLSSQTTIEAVKNNIKNLLLTNRGERLMQPSIGLNLREYLFEPLTDDLIMEMQNEINETISMWLPFITITNLSIEQGEENSIGSHQLLIDLAFIITRDPNTLASVQVAIDGGVLGGGGY
tara:strand:+ start:818 stop:1285 length:468 start_codon:yes stop_codon:yes gene_type:complete